MRIGASVEFQTEYFGKIPLFWEDAYWKQFDQKSFVKIEDKFISFWKIQNGVMSSGFSAPFGGFWAYHEQANTDSQALRIHFHKIMELARKENIEKLEVRLPPKILYPLNVASQEIFLREFGFTLKYSDTDHYLTLGTNIQSSFNRNRTRDLKKFNLDFEFKQVGLEDLSSVFEVITKNRALNEVPQNLSLSKLQILSHYTPEDLTLFLVKVPSGRPIAAAVCISLDESIFYVSQWGDIQKLFPEKFGSSPMAGLALGIFQHYLASNKKIAYLGTSSLHGLPDLGLYRFKESLGSERCAKNIWQKVLV